MKTETMLHRQAFMKHGCAVWSGTLCHEAHLRCMKRSLTASCFFCLGIKAKKMVDLVSLIRKILSSSNGFELIENGQYFVRLRKYLCFHRFWKQRILFCSTERTFSTKQTQYAPKNSCTSDFCGKIKNRILACSKYLLKILLLSPDYFFYRFPVDDLQKQSILK